MTDRELAGCALAEVLALLEKATPGPWRWSMNGNIVPQEYAQDCEIAAVYSEHMDDNGIPANAAAIISAVNFLRQHGPALLAALSTPSIEGVGGMRRGIGGCGRRRITPTSCHSSPDGAEAVGSASGTVQTQTQPSTPPSQLRRGSELRNRYP